MKPRTVVRLALIAAIAAIVPACARRSSDGSVETFLNLSLLARGGAGGTGSGGDGGSIDIAAQSASDVRVTRSGAISAWVAAPVVQPQLGTNPRTIAIDTQLTPTGTDQILGVDNLTAATGLWVRPGVTLTLLPNVDLVPPAGRDTARLNFTSGLFIEGTVAAGLREGSTVDTAIITIATTSFVVASTGRVLLPGIDSGGLGGSLLVTASSDVVNAGSIDATGGDGATGGSGGDVTFNANTSIFNGGTIVTSGGTSTAGTGGSAGDVALEASLAGFGGAFNNGSITARGATGPAGGDGGAILLRTNTLGGIASAGPLDASAGEGTAGTGGDAGDVTLSALNGKIVLSEAVSARGGPGTTGGDGGVLTIATSLVPPLFTVPPTGGIAVGASLDSSGGDGTVSGGSAGDVSIRTVEATGATPGLDPILLVGFALIDGSGGNGTTAGGDADGGGVNLIILSALDPAGLPYIGSIYNDADVRANGGRATAGPGGNASAVFLITDTDIVDVPFYDRSTVNRGAIEATGGNGTTGNGGDGGLILLIDHFRTENTGSLTATGGTSTIGVGGDGGDIEIVADGDVTNAAAALATGGASIDGNGGDGGNIGIAADRATTSGALNCSGGNVVNPAVLSGDGGQIIVFSTDTISTLAGTLSVANGTGTLLGTEGTVLVDGISVQLTNGAVTF